MSNAEVDTRVFKLIINIFNEKMSKNFIIIVNQNKIESFVKRFEYLDIIRLMESSGEKSKSARPVRSHLRRSGLQS